MSEVFTTVYQFSYTILDNNEVIDAILYKQLADDYALVQRFLDAATEDINAALTQVIQLSNPEVKLDLLRPLRESNRNMSQQDMTKFLSAVSALNNHILNRFEISDINVYLSANNIVVLPEWASLCEKTGITIDAAYIQS